MQIFHNHFEQFSFLFGVDSMSLVIDLADWESMESDEDNEIIKKRVIEQDERDRLSNLYGHAFEFDDEYNFFTTDDECDPEEKLEASGKITDGASEKKCSEEKVSEGDVEPMEEVMSTEMEKKKEKRKSEVDGIELQLNNGIEKAIEVKKKKKSASISEV
ncbi:hypothetical protein C5167_028812 [Papaver somniferum]|nr:hypothetical protein C5167_028812 [Papaver somniferum]